MSLGWKEYGAVVTPSRTSAILPTYIQDTYIVFHSLPKASNINRNLSSQGYNASGKTSS